VKPGKLMKLNTSSQPE